MVGTQVFVKGSFVGTTTDDNGAFSLSVESGATLMVAYIGYTTQEVTVSRGVGLLSVQLEPDVLKQDEVVVSGLASSVKRRNLATAVAKISGDELNGAPSQSLDQALGGKFEIKKTFYDKIDYLSGANIKNIKSVAHYFLGNYDYAKRLLNENVYISVAKPFLRDEELSEVIKKLPLDQIVIETDSYPQYFKKNRQRWTEPKDLLLIIEKLSKLKNIDPEYITEQIEKNSKNILDL